MSLVSLAVARVGFAFSGRAVVPPLVCSWVWHDLSMGVFCPSRVGGPVYVCGSLQCEQPIGRRPGGVPVDAIAGQRRQCAPNGDGVQWRASASLRWDPPGWQFRSHLTTPTLHNEHDRHTHSGDTTRPRTSAWPRALSYAAAMRAPTSRHTAGGYVAP